MCKKKFILFIGEREMDFFSKQGHLIIKYYIYENFEKV